MKVAIPLAKNVLALSANVASISPIDNAIQKKKKKKKMCERGVVRAGKEISLVVSHDDMDDIFKVIK